jgi:hypothetical protein
MNVQGKSQRPTLHSGQLVGVFSMAAHTHVSECVAAGTALVVVGSSWPLSSFLRH